MKKGYKKTKTWLKRLPLGYRERALSQVDKEWVGYQDGESSMEDAVETMCDWGCTKEGAKFWNEVFRHYSRGEPLPPLPKPEATHCLDESDIVSPSGVCAVDLEGAHFVSPFAGLKLTPPAEPFKFGPNPSIDATLKKTKTWLKQLPDGYRERALSQFDEEEPITDVASMPDAIVYGIVSWPGTVEGYRFWSEVHSHFGLGHDLPPLPEPEATHCIDVDSPEPQGIDATLQEREARYGSFRQHSRICQALKAAMKDGTKWESLSDSAKESLEMVQHKVARILNGDPTYGDNWHDGSGYFTLEENIINENAREEEI